MIWFDSVLATPGIGIRLIPKLSSLSDFQKGIHQFVDELNNHFDSLNIQKHEKDLWGYRILGNSFLWEILSSNLYFKFSYHFQEKREAGSLPVFSTPEIDSFSSLFQKILNHVDLFLDCSVNLEAFKFDRIGFISSISLDSENLPPGIGEVMDYLRKPWENGLLAFEGRFTSKLNQSNKDPFLEQCHHHFKFTEDSLDEVGYEITLDWQRVFDEPKTFSKENVSEEIQNSKARYFEYIEKFGEGNFGSWEANDE